jgi:PIN like domain
LKKKKSKKPSASSNVAQPNFPLLFIDRCAWSNRLGEVLKSAGIAFVPHHDHFEQACPDVDWLPIVGKNGWIVITRDKNIRRKPNELQAFKENNVLAIVLSSGSSSQASAADTAELLIRLYPKLMRKIQASKPPLMLNVTLMGTVSTVKL